MEYSPPPLFKQGASARAKVVFFSALAITLLAVDSRMHTLNLLRQTIGTALYPLQMLSLMPRDTANKVGDYFTSVSTLEQENRKLREQQTLNAQTLQQNQQLAAENAQLRRLLGTSERVPVKSLMSQILYDARDAFTRKIILDHGSQHGVVAGQPVIDDLGVVGQVTRVFPFSSEVTLLTDKDQAIPVQVVRNGLRSVAYGRGKSGALDLRFMATNADIQKGDMLVTSGIDGVYPPGLAVAKVVEVEAKSNDAFARIECQPYAGIDRNRQLLILLADVNIEPRPDIEDPSKKDHGKRHAHDAASVTVTTPPSTATPATTTAATGTSTAPTTVAPTPATNSAATNSAATNSAATNSAATTTNTQTIGSGHAVNSPAAGANTGNNRAPATPATAAPATNTTDRNGRKP